MWLFVAAMVVSAFLQAALVPLHLALLSVIFLSLRQEEESWVWLFMAGLAFDLITDLPVGFSGVLFLLAGALVRRVRETGYESLVAGGVIVLGTLATGFLQTFTWQWQPALATLALALPIWLLGRWWGGWQTERRLQLESL
jgi:hypothetical protein